MGQYPGPSRHVEPAPRLMGDVQTTSRRSLQLPSYVRLTLGAEAVLSMISTSQLFRWPRVASRQKTKTKTISTS